MLQAGPLSCPSGCEPLQAGEWEWNAQYVWIGLLTLAGVAAYSVDWRGIAARLRVGGRTSKAGVA